MRTPLEKEEQMGSITQEAHLPALGHHQREEVGRELADTVAERAVALGFFPDGQAAAVSAGSEIAAVERGALEADFVVHELVRRLADVAERNRGRMDRLEELDLASQDVLIEVVREVEKQLWMLRAQ